MPSMALGVDTSHLLSVESLRGEEWGESLCLTSKADPWRSWSHLPGLGSREAILRDAEPGLLLLHPLARHQGGRELLDGPRRTTARGGTCIGGKCRLL